MVVFGFPITTEDHIKKILDGLFDEYDPIITFMTSCLDPSIVEEIEAQLLIQEEILVKTHASVLFHTQVMIQSF